MQNWNQWQLSAGAVTTPMPQPPVGYAAPGADPMAMMQAYMQYYNQPAPSGYTPEQWAAAQQQSWAQWQQWQQQYQQWQAQYGGKYQETMKHMSAHNMSLAGQVPPLPNMQPPPLPKEDAKPPLPPNTINAYQFTNMPPPHQNNLPLFPAKQPTNNVMPQVTAPNCPQNPPLPPVQPPLPPENTPNKESSTSGKRGSNTVSEPSSVKKLKVEDEELTEAEKTFDAQFKQWEEQFNKWKQQNANHPDKTQYKQYEAKWTSWREKLIERREQMRKKREQQKQAAVKAETEKNLPGDDKILNILSSTENQGLINNLLGIGKTLGLTGKQNTNAPLPPPPPPPQTTISNMQSSTTMTVASQITTQQGMSQASGVNMMPSNVNPSSWTAQQWATQYNAGINMPNFSNFQSMSGIPPPPFGVPATQMPLPNFTQPPPNMPNFSQPPPGFGNNDATQFPHSNMRLPVPPTMQERSSFGPNDNVSEINRNDRQSISNNNFDSMKQPSSFGAGNHNVPKGQGMSTEHFGQDGPPKNIHDQGNQFRFNAPFGFRNDNYKFNNEGVSDADQFKRDDRNYSNRENNQFNHFASGNESFAPSSDRYGPDNDRLGSGNDRYGSNNERFGPGSDRFGTGNDRFVSNNDRFVPGNDRFNSGNDRFGLNDRFESNNDRFTSASDRLGGGNEHFGPGSDRFSRSNLERFEQKDVTDNRRDGFGSGSHGFNRNNQFEPPDELAPELKKLMEKRRAAMDVFKPSFFDPDKSSSASSLSESFKKIAGDAPFIPKTSDFGQKDQYGTRGNTNFGSRGGPNFSMPNNQRILGPDFRSREPNDFKPSSSLEFSPRSSLGFNPRNNDLRESGISDFRGSLDNFNRNIHGSTDFNQRSGKEFEPRSNASPKQVEYAANVISSDKDCSFVEKVQELSVQKNESIGKNEFTEADKQEIEENTLEKDSTKDRSLKQEIPLEKPPWMDVSFPEENSPRKNSSEQDGNTPTFVKQDQSTNSGDNLDPTESINDETMKKPETLPFMGENDPKPEDLNMEPPPELPNLGPILTDFVNESSFDNSQRTNESFDAKQSSGHFETKDNFDHSTFGSKGIYKPPPPPSPFGPRGPNDGRFLFGPRGPNNFSFGNGPTRPQIPVDRLFPPPADFGLRDPNDEPFIARGTMDGQFGPRGSNNRQFGPCRPNDTSLDSRGFDDHFSSRPTGDGSFPLPPNDKFFGSRRGPNDVVPNIRGSQDSTFAPRGANDGQFRGPRNGPFCPRGFADKIFDTRSSDNTFGPSGTNDRQFGPPRFSGPNEVPFVSRNSSDGSGQNRGDFGNRPPFGARAPDFRLRGQFDNAVCSKGANDSSKLNVSPLMPYKSESCRLDDIHEIHSERTVEINNADVQNSDLGKSSTLESNDKQSEYRNTDCGHLYGEVQKAEWRQNNFGDIDQRSRFDSGNTEKSDDQNERNQNSTGQRLNFSINKSSTPVDKLRTEKSASDCTTSSGHGEPSSGMDKFNNLIAYTKRSLDRQTQMRGPAAKEFCIEKQFNYNHGGTGDNKFIEHVPAKIIDYAHAPRTAIHDHLTPAQCFDYGHGNLKPVVPDHEIHPRKDFRNWVENEQNLREYADKIKKYENSIVRKDFRRPADYSKKRDWSMDDRKCERERRDRTGDLKDKEDRIFDSSFDKDQDDRLRNDRSNNKERIQERCDISRKDVKKENDKNDDRSKGNINWQESLNKNVIETKSQDISIPDVQHNVLESAPKTLELAKTPNCTMVDDLLCPPGRQNRPPKIVIILRGPPGSGKSFVAKLIKDKEVEQGGSAPRILSLDDYFLVEKEIESKDDNEKKVIVKEMVYEYEEAMEHSYIISLIKAFKKNITDGFFNFIILDCINEKISDYEEMWSFAKSKGFRVYVCEMEMDLQICLKRNVHNRTEEEINRIIDYFEPTPSYHQKLDVNSMLQEQAIEEVHMEDSQETQDKSSELNEDSQDSQEDLHDTVGVSKWERMEAEDKLDRLDGLAKRKNESKPQTMEDFLQVPDYYNMEDTSGKKRVRWADLEERKEQEKMRAVGFVVGHTNWDRMMDPTKGGSALTRTKYI